ncbi:NADH-quinone oxidoreductase subunit C [Holophaga foetida]|uniref:NADH-quinone oxidoreductase subunit C n=1 Tax=Holophaga foetida TaxID=35839 RepID=UPI0002472186|nr:NADH-quinone oxidoreductase subunit C [Holophaga foetida]
MIIERMESAMPGAVLDHHAFRGDRTVVVLAGRLPEVAALLFEEGFQQLMDVTAVDWYEREPRFDVVYHFLNLVTQERIRLKAQVREGEALPSLSVRFRSAEWSEREVFDMFGIPFTGHPNLERLLMWKDFPGHPLRKDFPMDGGDAFCTGDTGTSYAGRACTLNL